MFLEFFTVSCYYRQTLIREKPMAIFSYSKLVEALKLKEENARRSAKCTLKKLREASDIFESFGAKKVLLFGSYARGKNHPTSDIDLIVVGIPEDSYYRLKAALESRFHRTVDLHTENEGRELVLRALRDGVTVYEA